MKRIFLSAVAAALLAVPAMAQLQQIKVDKAAILKKAEKSDADINDPKKNTKAALWLDRGKTYYEAASKPISGLYGGITSAITEQLYGKPQSTRTETIDDVTFDVLSYPFFDAYFSNGVIAFWKVTDTVYPNAADVAFSAYEKAYELDIKSAPKVNAGMMELANYYKQTAGNAFAGRDYQDAAVAFRKAYDIQRHPAVGTIDTLSLYNAGFLFTVTRNFEDALPALQETLKYGYNNDGDTYYYLFHALYGLGRKEDSKQVLLKGLAAYPKNNKIVEGLIGIYNETNSDPKEILPVVERAIQEDPKNASLWSGLGHIYDKLGEPEKSIEAYIRATELDPGDFTANFNLGLMYVKSGDELNAQMSEKNYTTQTAYNQDLEAVLAEYAKSLAPLERAHGIMPAEPVTVELLKNVTFRLREREGMMEKYEMYDKLLKELQ